MSQIQLYSPEISSRLKYVSNFIFDEVLKLPVRLIANKESLNTLHPVIEYHNTPNIKGSFVVKPHGLLSSTNIEMPSFVIKDGLIIFSDYETCKQLIPFDPFALVFFFISRFEEYTFFEKDAHGRFSASQSIQHKFGMVHLPIVDLIIDSFKDHLQKYFTITIDPISKPKPTMTFDIDRAWLYKQDSFFQSLMREIKLLFKGNFDQVKEKKNIRKSLTPDPFDIEELIEKYAFKNVIFFFLFAERSLNDRGISPSNQSFKSLISKISNTFPIGIHPSYESNNNMETLRSEYEGLSLIAKHPITLSRQHYLKLSFPETFRNLIEIGITHDFTMGYADQVGYRSGTGHPHKWYDLLNEESTALTIVPFQIMDVTLKKYMNLSTDKAIDVSKSMIDQASKLGSPLHILWHNSSFYPPDGWKGWEKVFEYLYAHCN